MNLPNCDNFCTAEKCLELEQKIAELQVQINELTSLVNDHINQDIPEAHNYTPLVLVESFIESDNQGNRIKQKVEKVGKYRFSSR